jgi:hypothetical protein
MSTSLWAGGAALPFFSNRNKTPAGLSYLDRCRGEEEVLSTVPPLVQGMIEAVQKESIRFYRRVHSHDMGNYRAVRDEFFYVLLSVVRRRIEGLLKGEEVGRALVLLRAELSAFLSAIDRAFDRERFWSAWDERCAEYCAVLLPEHQADLGLAADALAPSFGRHLTSHLDEHAAKVMHFSAHSLRDLLRAT